MTASSASKPMYKKAAPLLSNDHKTQDAVIRNPEVIGQAVIDLGTERLSAEQPAIPWTQIAGARNVLAHQYLGVDLNLVWNIVEQNLPALKAAIHETAARLAISLPGHNDQQNPPRGARLRIIIRAQGQ